jgi:hypothetical protein
MSSENRQSTSAEDQLAEEKEPGRGGDRADLIALFRLLFTQPPKDHDCRACLICQRYGIIEI